MYSKINKCECFETGHIFGILHLDASTFRNAEDEMAPALGKMPKSASKARKMLFSIFSFTKEKYLIIIFY